MRNLADRNELLKFIGRRRIAVLMGGTSAEREISLLTGQAMLEALRRKKIHAFGVDLQKFADLADVIRKKPAAVVNGLHGPGGEDGQVQGALELGGIPYTGPRLMAAALAMDKHRTKQLLQAAGLPTAPWVLCGPTEKKRISAALRLPVVIKPNRQGSAIGVSIVRKIQELDQAWELACRYGDEILAEQYVAGREISVGLLRGKALPVIEIVPKKNFYDYEAKYAAGMSEHIVPARLPAAQTRQVQAWAEQAAQMLGCQGTPRVDMIVPARGKAVILEVNTLPGMTATSLLPEAAKSAGIDFDHLVLQLLAEAFQRESA